MGLVVTSRLLILFIIGTIPVLFAAVQPWIWSFYSACMIAAFLFLLWQSRIRFTPISFNSINLTMTLFFTVTIFLCLPLPVFTLSYLSPVRFQTLTNVQELLNRPFTWQTLSYSPQIALSWWIFLLSLWLLFISVRSLCTHTNNLRHLVYIMIGVALIEAVYGLVQALVPTLGVLWVDYIQAYMGNARGTFINRNHFAGFLEMVWPVALGFTLAHGGWGQGYNLKKLLGSETLNRQALLALGIVVLLLALLFSRSRAGILSASMGFLTFILLVRSGGRGMSRLTWLLLVGIVGMLVAYSIAIGIGPITERFFRLSDGDSRLDFWRDSLAIIKDHPFGIGLRNYEKVFPIYNVSMLADKRLEFAHNDYLQLLIEAGWIGFISVLSGFLIFMWKSVARIKRMNSRKNPMRFFIAVGAFSGLVSMAFHSFFDFNLQIPANCVYFVTLMAIVYSCSWQSTDYADDTDGSTDYSDDTDRSTDYADYADRVRRLHRLRRTRR